MARIHQSGFEQNSLATNIEWSTVGTTGASITTGAARSGARGLQISSLSSGTAAGVLFKWLASTASGPFFLRAYINIQTLPSASNHIMSFNSASGTVGTSERCKITLESNGTLILRNASGTQIGSASSTLSTNTWYRIELKTDSSGSSGSRTIEGRLNGTVFATTSTETQGDSFAYSVGGNLDTEAQTTGQWWFDDIALNDSTGSYQNSYPGEGRIINLKPNAQGDINDFPTATGGTAGQANNYTRVNEVTPNATTTFNQATALNQEDLFNVEDSNIWQNDTVNVVMVGIQAADSTAGADAVTAVKAEIMKASGGTIAQGSAFIPNTTTFNVNANAVPRNYTLTTYNDPDGSPWTQSTLDTMQIGYKETAFGTRHIRVSSVWATVDYTESTSGIRLNMNNKATGVDASGNFTVTYPKAPTAGNLLIITVGSDDTGFATPSGWTLAAQSFTNSSGPSDDRDINLFYKISDGSETTVNFTGFTTSTTWACYEWLGLDTSSPLDQTATANNSGGGTTIGSGTTSTTTQADELLFVAARYVSATGLATWSNGFTTLVAGTSGDGILHLGGFKVVSSTGAYSSTATMTTGTKAAGLIATFKAAGAPPLINSAAFFHFF